MKHKINVKQKLNMTPRDVDDLVENLGVGKDFRKKKFSRLPEQTASQRIVEAWLNPYNDNGIQALATQNKITKQEVIDILNDHGVY